MSGFGLLRGLRLLGQDDATADAGMCVDGFCAAPDPTVTQQAPDGATPADPAPADPAAD